MFFLGQALKINTLGVVGIFAGYGSSKEAHIMHYINKEGKLDSGHFQSRQLDYVKEVDDTSPSGKRIVRGRFVKTALPRIVNASIKMPPSDELTKELKQLQNLI